MKSVTDFAEAPSAFGSNAAGRGFYDRVAVLGIVERWWRVGPGGQVALTRLGHKCACDYICELGHVEAGIGGLRK